MRVGIVAPLDETVPPRGYGAIEALVAALADGLVARGHKVTLFAAAGSRTAADLVSFPVANVSAPHPQHVRDKQAQLEEVRRRLDSFDVIQSNLHSGVGCLPAFLLASSGPPVLHTLHSRVTSQVAVQLAGLPRANFVAVSFAQRQFVPEIQFRSVIHPGVDSSLFPRPRCRPRPYVAFLGRLSAVKAPHVAIQAAFQAGVPIRLAGRIKLEDRIYFANEVEPLLAIGQAEYVGELGFAEKVAFLRAARATLLTSINPEPFGLVMLESMACGTPVIALDQGAPREVVIDGVTGWIVTSAAGAADAIKRVDRLDPNATRSHVRRNFSAQKMVGEYEALFRRATSGQRPKIGANNGKRQLARLRAVT